MQGERRLANGERTGQLGGKRRVQLDAHCFSPKNATQLLRLAWCGVYLFKTGEFPVRIDYYDSKFSDMLLDIKTKPENYTKSQLNEMFDVAESMLVAEYDKRSVNSKFDSDLATNILLKSYLPFLKLSFTTDETTLIERQFDVIH